MPQYDVTFKDKKVVPSKVYNPYVAVVERKLKASQWKMVNRIFDEAIDALVEDCSLGGKLVWTKTAALVGRSSQRPKHDIDRLWDRMVSCFGEDKQLLKAMGSMLNWKIAQREETWLSYRQQTDDIDPDTGKRIVVSTYWIDESYTPPGLKKNASLGDLSLKFNKRAYA